MKISIAKKHSYIEVLSLHDSGVRNTILNTIIASFALLVVLYMIFLSTMVFDIVHRKNLEAQAVNLTNEVANLELEYLALSNKIDLEYSHSLGFVETNITYATNKALGVVKLSQNEI